jgi:hypothetical protein
LTELTDLTVTKTHPICRLWQRHTRAIERTTFTPEKEKLAAPFRP